MQHERYDFFKTSSRKSLVSNIHYRVTANAIVGNLAGVSVYIFKWQVLPQPVMSYRKTFTMQPLHKANLVRTCSLRFIKAFFFLKTDLGRNIFL